MNPTYWDQISAEDQQTIKSVLTDACVEMADQSMAKEDEFVQQFKDLGVTVSEADKASFAAVVPDLFTLLGLDPPFTIRSVRPSRPTPDLLQEKRMPPEQMPSGGISGIKRERRRFHGAGFSQKNSTAKWIVIHIPELIASVALVLPSPLP